MGVEKVFTLLLFLGVCPIAFGTEVSQSTPDPASAPSYWFNASVNPVGLLFGIVGIEAEARVSPMITVGGAFNWFQTQSGRNLTRAFEYELDSTIYLTGQAFTTSWVIKPALLLTQIGLDRSNANTSATHTYAGYFATTAGRTWTWGSGFNLYLGTGVAVGCTSAARGVQPVLKSQVGWMF